MNKRERLQKVAWHEKAVRRLKDEYSAIEDIPNIWENPTSLMQSRLYFIRQHQKHIHKLLCKNKDSASMTS